MEKCISLWSRLVEHGKVSCFDEGFFVVFKCFYKSYMKKHDKRPGYKEALLFLGSYEKN